MSNSEFCRIEPNVAIREHVEASGASIISFTSYSGGGEMGASLILPRRLSSDTPLLTTSGHLGEEFAYIPPAMAAVEEGIAVVVTGQAKSQDIRQAARPAHAFHPERLQAQLLCKVVRDLKSEGIERVDGTGHSKGGCAVVGAAVRCPDRFKSVTLWGSAGTSKHGLLSLLARTPRVGREVWSERDRLQANFEPILGESAKIFVSYLINNALRVAGETVAVTRSNTRETLRLLSREVPTGAMVYQNDGFFKPEEVAKKILGIVHDFRELPDVGHLAPQTHPKEVIAAQLEMLEIYEDHPLPVAA